MTPLQQRIEEATAISDVRAVLDALYTLVLAPTKQFNRSREERLRLWERASTLADVRAGFLRSAPVTKRPKPRVKPDPEPAPALTTANNA